MLTASNTLAAIVAAAGAVGAVAPHSGRGAPARAAAYLAASAAAYCLRRGLLHSAGADGKPQPLGAAEVLRRHLAYEADWHDAPRDGLSPAGGCGLLDAAHASRGLSLARGRLLHGAHVLGWLLLFLPCYPLLEAALYPLDMACFWFYYPKARGCGLIVDSRALRRRGKRGNAAQLLRLDWHRFELNVGPSYPLPNTGRHPPRAPCHLPHVDLPQRGVRHWPWRQHTSVLMRLLPTPQDGSGPVARPRPRV